MDASAPALPVVPRRRQSKTIHVHSMLAKFSCPHCSVMLTVDASLPSAEGSCPACTKMVHYVKAPEVHQTEPSSGSMIAVRGHRQRPSRGPLPAMIPLSAEGPAWPSRWFFQDAEVTATKAERRWIPATAGAAAVLVLILVVVFGTGSQLPVMAAVPAAAPPPPPAKLVPQAPEKERQMRETLRAFAAARDHAARLDHVLRAEECGSELQAYYKNKPADFETTRLAAAIPVALPVTVADDASGVGVLRFDVPGLPSRVMFFKRSGPDSRFRLDWETYCQEMDFSLDRFLAGEGSRHGIFRLRLEKVHQFSGNASGNLLLALSSPTGRRFGVQLSIPDSHSDYPRLAEQLEWDRRPLATVSLSREGSTAVLDRFVCWESLGVGNNAEARSPLAAR